MSDVVKQYQDAVREYDKTRSEATKKIHFIDGVSSALRNSLSAFLFRSYSLPTATRDSYQSNRGGFDMNLWPDAANLKKLLTDWHAAFARLHETWGAIPAGDRVGLKEPPEKMDST